ncbi:MAG TPA: SDR family oxidoreductase [Nitrososphaeraceae archaeon]|nr:SDR family oxidoreductase [Nitrososphaeraceae archaeon]
MHTNINDPNSAVSDTGSLLPSQNHYDKKVAVVTGSSSGIGYETALSLARNGLYTYATMRNLNKSKEIIENARNASLPLKVLELDVTSDESVSESIANIYGECGRIDVVVNNAGYALVGTVEDLSMEELRGQFETNFFGAVRVIKAVLPHMRKQRSGTIVNVTSMGGRIAIPLDPAYHATKFALEGLSESMQYETSPFGIRIIVIEPGVVSSNFYGGLKIAKMSVDSSKPSPYSQMMQGIEKAAGQMLKYAIPPAEVAKVIVNAVSSNNPDFRYIVGDDAIQLIGAARSMSDREFREVMEKRFLSQL